MRCPFYFADWVPGGYRQAECEHDAGHPGLCGRLGDGPPAMPPTPSEVGSAWTHDQWLEALEAGRKAGTVAPVTAITTGLSYAMADGRLWRVVP